MEDETAEIKPSDKKILDFASEVLRNCFKKCSKNEIEPEPEGENNLTSLSNISQLFPSEREVYNFEKIWKLVQKSLPDVGRKLFVRLFTSHPHLSKYFDKFRGLEGDQLMGSVAMEVHGMVVLSTIDEIVSHLEEGPQLIWEILKELGESHAKFGSQLKPEDFWSIEEAFIESVNENLGGLRPKPMKLLRKVTRFLISGIVRGMEDEVKRIAAEGKERVATNIMGLEHSHKRLDLSEMIEKDMEEKIHQNEILHQHHDHHHHHHGHHHHGHHGHHHEHHHAHHGHHHHHHHEHHHHGHHGHQHHHHKHGSTHSITDTSLNIDWMIARQSQPSGFQATNPVTSSGSHGKSVGTIHQPATNSKSQIVPDVE